ncbi:hypothetical protein [Reinekea sp. G2M2-21]|uniref:hypothetical protein n=1 Tax=Reinekea sp. G2M2-21 TaxID=2788942 RepID=UPI0018A9AB76|nr:hypothetical protein [Reinekea sp. G2M2-21]
MGMFDNVTISKEAIPVPERLRKTGYQTKELDCDDSQYEVDPEGRFLKVMWTRDRGEERFFACNLSCDVGCYDGIDSFYLRVRNGRVWTTEPEMAEVIPYIPDLVEWELATRT